MFGTDGVRGLVNQYPMTPELAMKFGMAIGAQFNESGRFRVVISKDTRLSGYMLESAVVAGLVAVGADVTLVGPMPTPAVPMLIRSLRADFGVMITASHNPHHDNGFKLFYKNGMKLSRDCEMKIQDTVLANNFDRFLAKPENLGKVIRLDDASGRYIEHVKSAFPRGMTLNGLRIVLDCANGAGYKIATTVLWELGAEVIAINDRPSGVNINVLCGSTHPEQMMKKVVQTRAELGIALDGDADRVVICDENGNIIDGDHVIAVIANYISRQNDRQSNSIVVTDISNGALASHMMKSRMEVWNSKVGDRNVAEEMMLRDSIMGGEASGHIIIREYGMTGDGLIAALHFLAAMVHDQKKASEFSSIFDLYPQYKANIHYYGESPLQKEEVQSDLDKISCVYSHLRIIVRLSGTEKVIRVMVEGVDKDEIKDVGQQIKAALVKHIVAESKV